MDKKMKLFNVALYNDLIKLKLGSRMMRLILSGFLIPIPRSPHSRIVSPTYGGAVYLGI